jgi:hypothetical protein
LLEEIIFSRFSQITASEVENHFLIDHVESDKSRFTHLLQISQIRARSAGLSKAGVKSILKSQVCTILNQLGVSTTTQAQSGTEWFTLKNSILKLFQI